MPAQRGSQLLIDSDLNIVGIAGQDARAMEEWRLPSAEKARGVDTSLA